MGINNPGSNSIYHGVQTQNASSITNGIDVFGGGNSPPVNSYITEDSSAAYITEDASAFYVTES